MQHQEWAKAAFVVAIAAIGLGGVASWLLGERGEASAVSASFARLPASSSAHGPASQPPASQPPASQPPASARAPSAMPRARDGAGLRFDRARADALRERAALRRATEQRAAEPAHSAAGASEGPGPVGEAQAAMTPEEEERRRDFIRQAVREQYIPVARSCYEELLDREPEASGKVVMSFAIAGVGDAGVVDRVDLRDDTTMDDPEFTQCMRESMYSTVFEPPPRGATETTVVYPLELHP